MQLKNIGGNNLSIRIQNIGENMSFSGYIRPVVPRDAWIFLRPCNILWIHFKFKLIDFIFSKSFGEFVAEIVVIVDKGEWDARGDTANAMSVEKALEKAAKSGRIGSLQVDTESLKLKEAGKLAHHKIRSLALKEYAYRISDSRGLGEGSKIIPKNQISFQISFVFSLMIDNYI